MKNCPKCEKEKDVKEFNKSKAEKDGLNCWCRECHAEYCKPYKKSKKYKEYQKQYRQTESCKEAMKRGRKKYVERNPEKIKAKNAINNAIAYGKMDRGACEICGESNADGHHPDYSKPLDVKWLCHQHHMDHHNNEKEKANG